MLVTDPYNNNVSINDEQYILTDEGFIPRSFGEPDGVYTTDVFSDPVYTPVSDPVEQTPIEDVFTTDVTPTDTLPVPINITPTPTPQPTVTGNKVMDWIKANPLLAILIGAGIYSAVKTNRA